MRKNVMLLGGLALVVCVVLGGIAARADGDGPAPCRDVPSHAALRAALESARAQPNGFDYPPNSRHALTDPPLTFPTP